MIHPTDLIDTLQHISPGSPLAALRAERAAIRGHAEGTYRALLLPPDPGGLSLHDRAALAAQVAHAEADTQLAHHFTGLTAGHEAGQGAPSPLLAHYAETVAAHPARIDQPRIDALAAAGLSPQDIVALTQLVAFIPYQVRLRAGLRALQGHPGTPLPTPPMADRRFTMAEVAWTPRISPVDAATATPAQLAALDACPPAQRRSTYFLTLAQDPASLAERGALFNAVMYAPRGLPRAERELATAIVSMVNGCVYCCAVHARRFAELSHDPAFMQTLLDQGSAAPATPRQHAIIAFAAKLTATPAALGTEDLVPLRTAGLADLELLDLIHATAMFANANRLMQALGESVPPA